MPILDEKMAQGYQMASSRTIMLVFTPKDQTLDLSGRGIISEWKTNTERGDMLEKEKTDLEDLEGMSRATNRKAKTGHDNVERRLSAFPKVRINGRSQMKGKTFIIRKCNMGCKALG
jgi:hypothetical protein